MKIEEMEADFARLVDPGGRRKWCDLIILETEWLPKSGGNGGECCSISSHLGA